jgi:polar amino acid transport system substrate-binding protein
MRKPGLALLIGLVLLGLLVGCGQEADQPSTTAGDESASEIPQLDRKILIGTDATYPPFEVVDESTGEVVGFDPDMMAEIAELTGVEYEFQPTAWDGIFAALAAKEFDAVLSAVTIYPDRAEIVDFTTPYYQVGQVVSVRADEEDINGYEDLADGAIVGVQLSTTGDFATTDEANVPEDNVRRFDTIDLAYQALLNGDLDAVVADSPTTQNYVTRFEGEIKIVGGEGEDAWFTTEDYGIAVQKGDDELNESLSAAIEKLKKDGTIQELLEKWEVE